MLSFKHLGSNIYDAHGALSAASEVVPPSSAGIYKPNAMSVSCTYIRGSA